MCVRSDVVFTSHGPSHLILRQTRCCTPTGRRQGDLYPWLLFLLCLFRFSGGESYETGATERNYRLREIFKSLLDSSQSLRRSFSFSPYFCHRGRGEEGGGMLNEMDRFVLTSRHRCEHHPAGLRPDREDWE